jgi:hypothetical protein
MLNFSSLLLFVLWKEQKGNDSLSLSSISETTYTLKEKSLENEYLRSLASFSSVFNIIMTDGRHETENIQVLLATWTILFETSERVHSCIRLFPIQQNWGRYEKSKISPSSSFHVSHSSEYVSLSSILMFSCRSFFLFPAQHWQYCSERDTAFLLQLCLEKRERWTLLLFSEDRRTQNIKRSNYHTSLINHNSSFAGKARKNSQTNHERNESWK